MSPGIPLGCRISNLRETVHLSRVGGTADHLRPTQPSPTTSDWRRRSPSYWCVQFSGELQTFKTVCIFFAPLSHSIGKKSVKIPLFKENCDLVNFFYESALLKRFFRQNGWILKQYLSSYQNCHRFLLFHLINKFHFQFLFLTLPESNVMFTGNTSRLHFFIHFRSRKLLQMYSTENVHFPRSIQFTGQWVWFA